MIRASYFTLGSIISAQAEVWYVMELNTITAWPSHEHNNVYTMLVYIIHINDMIIPVVVK